MRKYLLVIFALLVITGCSQENLTGGAYEQTDEFIHDSFTLTPSSIQAFNQQTGKLPISINAPYDLLYIQGYVSGQGGQWQQISIPSGRPYENWVRGGSNIVVYIDPAALVGESSQRFVALYGCNLVDDVWDCNDDTWMISELEILEGECNTSCTAYHVCFALGDQHPTSPRTYCESTGWTPESQPQMIHPVRIPLIDFSNGYSINLTEEDISLLMPTTLETGFSSSLGVNSLQISNAQFTLTRDELEENVVPALLWQNGRKMLSFETEFVPSAAFPVNFANNQQFSQVNFLGTPYNVQRIGGLNELDSLQFFSPAPIESFRQGETRVIEFFLGSEVYILELTLLSVGEDDTGTPIVRLLGNGESSDDMRQGDFLVFSPGFRLGIGAISPTVYGDHTNSQMGSAQIIIQPDRWRFQVNSDTGIASIDRNRDDVDDALIRFNFTIEQSHNETVANISKYTFEVEADDHLHLREGELISEILSEPFNINPTQLDISFGGLEREVYSQVLLTRANSTRYDLYFQFPSEIGYTIPLISLDQEEFSVNGQAETTYVIEHPVVNSEGYLVDEKTFPITAGSSILLGQPTDFAQVAYVNDINEQQLVLQIDGQTVSAQIDQFLSGPTNSLSSESLASTSGSFSWAGTQVYFWIRNHSNNFSAAVDLNQDESLSSLNSNLSLSNNHSIIVSKLQQDQPRFQISTNFGAHAIYPIVDKQGTIGLNTPPGFWGYYEDLDEMDYLMDPMGGMYYYNHEQDQLLAEIPREQAVATLNVHYR